MLQSDLLQVMTACTEGTLADTEVQFADGAAACVILASGGYPVQYEKGKPITGLTEGQLPEAEGVTVYHSGTAVDAKGRLVTAGGRVLGVTAVADALPGAVTKAYAAAEQIGFEGLHKRSDIGSKHTRTGGGSSLWYIVFMWKKSPALMVRHRLCRTSCARCWALSSSPACGC